MFANEKRWKSLWRSETRPRHSKETKDFYQSYSKELRLLIGEPIPNRVLELGCGNGALYPYLGFSEIEKYTGVDVSASMISEFKKHFPEISLIVQDGEQFLNSEKYDLIFSNGLVQYFTSSMLQQHIVNSKTMLAEDGRILMAMIPWKTAHSAYCQGELIRSASPGLIRALKVRFGQWKHGWMGRWTDHRELARLAAKHDLSVTFHGSLHYPYRIHAMFERM